MKKFELTDEFITDASGHKLFRIKALSSFGTVSAGDMGGYVEKEENLSNDGSSWVSGNAQVSGDAWVFGDARVYGDAQVSGNACAFGNAHVSGDASVYGDAQVSGDARVYGDASFYGDAHVSGNADFAVVAGFGRYFRATTFFRCEDKILRVQCGCFYGDLAQFREIVKKTHGDSKYAKEYLAIADLMELHFSDEEENQESDE
jgi:hypothetical protein